MKRPLVLVILDGWGHSAEMTGNPFYGAKLPAFNFLKEQYPTTLLQASGPAVGLSWGEPGNSEAGHMNLGAGRIVPQYSVRIDKDIKEKNLENNQTFKEIKNHLEKNQSRIHLAGLLTSGRVHSTFDHPISLVEILEAKGIQNIFLHLFTDGKDSGLKESPILLEKIGNAVGSRAAVADLIGRDFAMDRNHNWNLTQKAFDLLIQRKGVETENLIQGLKNNQESGFDDSNMIPLVNKIMPDGNIKSNDAVLFFNFREDSMRQLIQAFTEENFTFFPRELPKNLFIVTMTQYIEKESIRILFPQPDIKMGLSEALSKEGKNQLHIAESEKYAHVTYFFNGLNTRSHEREIDFFVDSLKDAEQSPEMKSKEITDKILEELKRDFHDFIVVNYANADVLAHTGNFNAAIESIEAVDRSLSRLYTAIMEKNGTMIITSDHGNVESLTYKGSGEKEAKHDTNPVPFILVRKDLEGKKGSPKKVSGILADVAPTILDLIEIKKPEEMTGQSLIDSLI